MSEIPNGIPEVLADPAVVGTPVAPDSTTETVPTTPDQGTPAAAAPEMIPADRYKEAQAWGTKAAQEAAYLKRRVEELESRIATATPAAQVQPVDEYTAKKGQLLDNVDETVAPLLGEMFDLFDKKIKEVSTAAAQANQFVSGSLGQELDSVMGSAYQADARMNSDPEFEATFLADLNISLGGGDSLTKLAARVNDGKGTKQDLNILKTLIPRSLEFAQLKRGPAKPTASQTRETEAQKQARAVAGLKPVGIGGGGSDITSTAPILDLEKVQTQADVERIADEQLKALGLG
jgi:hypothetical protein